MTGWLCAHCGQEFEDWVTVCADCGRPLTLRSSRPVPPDELGKEEPVPTLIARYEREAAARAAAKILEADQIEAEILDSPAPAAARELATTYSLFVAYDDEQRARSVLHQAERRAQDSRQFQELPEDDFRAASQPTYRSAELRAGIVQFLLVLNMLVAVAWIALLLRAVLDLPQGNPLLDSDSSHLSLLGSIDQVFWIESLCLLFGNFILFLPWIFRIRENTQVLWPHEVKTRPDWLRIWALGPLWFAFFPFYWIAELWRSNHRRSLAKPTVEDRTEADSPGIIIWWSSVLLWMALVRIRDTAHARMDSANDTVLVFILAFAAESMLLLACLLTLRIVRQIQAAQLSLLRLVTSSS